MMTILRGIIVLQLATGFTLTAGSQEHGVVKESERIGEERDVLVFRETIHLKPPFYRGPMPLVYQAGKRSSGIYGGMMDIVYWHKFDDWRNQFSYNNVFILEVAEARSSQGKLLAKAELVEVREDARRLVYRETHYNAKGAARFICLSQYGVGAGFKLKEDPIQGIKERDFFFLLPL